MKRLAILLALVVAAAMGGGWDLAAIARDAQQPDAPPAAPAANGMCDDVACAHLDARMMAIESVIRERGAQPAYLALGDSHVEFADLPELCGRKPINAGIAGATSETFVSRAAMLADLAKPDFIVIALGANDGWRGKLDTFDARMRRLLHDLSAYRVLVAPAPLRRDAPGASRINEIIAALPAAHVEPLQEIETKADGVHLSAQAYARWSAALEKAASAVICPK